MKEQGFSDINLVGGSMGGAAMLAALDSTSIAIPKVVLLAPAGGPPIISAESDKLFVVSENERMFSGVMAIYNGSSKYEITSLSIPADFRQYGFNTAYTL